VLTAKRPRARSARHDDAAIGFNDDAESARKIDDPCYQQCKKAAVLQAFCEFNQHAIDARAMPSRSTG
jgi:hypothetical protein